MHTHYWKNYMWNPACGSSDRASQMPFWFFTASQLCVLACGPGVGGGPNQTVEAGRRHSSATQPVGEWWNDKATLWFWLWFRLMVSNSDGVVRQWNKYSCWYLNQQKHTCTTSDQGSHEGEHCHQNVSICTCLRCAHEERERGAAVNGGGPALHSGICV